MSPALRVGVVGCGVGRQHVAAFQSLPSQFQVTALCDVDQEKARAVAANAGPGVLRIATDMAELCRMDEVDVVDICTPPHLHYEQSLQALAAGKHVICEKPLARSLRQVDELIAAEAQSGRRLMPIFQYRFRAGLQKLKLLVDAGVAGRAYLTTARPVEDRDGGADVFAGDARARCDDVHSRAGDERICAHGDAGEPD
jgi:predicted dehydrogenase